ncbi:hypothetical protein Ccrd_001013, partial [Cynara cardunculus var. scolymus]
MITPSLFGFDFLHLCLGFGFDFLLSLSKRTLKLVRKAAEHKCLKRGVKEVVKSIRRGATKRPTCCVLVLTKPTKGELGEEE